MTPTIVCILKAIKWVEQTIESRHQEYKYDFCVHICIQLWRDKMHLFEAMIALNISICYSFQSLDDLENFYKSDPVFDPFGLPG